MPDNQEPSKKSYIFGIIIFFVVVAIIGWIFGSPNENPTAYMFIAGVIGFALGYLPEKSAKEAMEKEYEKKIEYRESLRLQSLNDYNRERDKNSELSKTIRELKGHKTENEEQQKDYDYEDDHDGEYYDDEDYDDEDYDNLNEQDSFEILEEIEAQENQNDATDTKYTVSLNYNYDGYESQYSKNSLQISVKHGATYEPPLYVVGNHYLIIPGSKTEFIFRGWFVDFACTIPWTSSDIVTCDITLYAKWEKETS